MWVTVLLMAVVASRGPARIAAIVVMLSRSRPLRLLVAFFIGGFGVSLIVGAVILFVLEGIGGAAGSGLAADAYIAIGVFALLVAVLVGTGIAGRVRRKVQARRQATASVGAGADTVDPAAAEEPGGVERSPTFQKLPVPIQKALQRESIWVAWLAGAAVGMPSLYYLAAIAAIVGSDAGVGTSIAALVVFNVIAFMLTELFIVSFMRAPDATRERVDRLYAWTTSRHRLLVTVVAGIVGIYLLILGISKY
jgi:hypothetical protein